MRKKTLMSMATVATLSLLLFAGCGEVQQSDAVPTNTPVVTATGCACTNSGTNSDKYSDTNG